MLTAFVETDSQTICLECELAMSSLNLKDWRQDFLCSDCAARYYLACSVCALLIARDEAYADSETIRCPNCAKASGGENETNETELAATEIETLVAEYLRLYAEEKLLAERLEAIKEKLKLAASHKRGAQNTVTFTSADEAGQVKCSFKSSIKCKNEAVEALSRALSAEAFSAVFTPKISYSTDKAKIEAFLNGEIVTDETRQMLLSAAEETETVTLTVARGKK